MLVLVKFLNLILGLESFYLLVKLNYHELIIHYPYQQVFCSLPQQLMALLILLPFLLKFQTNYIKLNLFDDLKLFLEKIVCPNSL